MEELPKTRKRAPKIQEMDPTVVSESLTRQIATFLLTNASIADCAKTLGISASSVRTVIESPRYKEMVTLTAEAELGPLLAKTKNNLARQAPTAVKVMQKAMQDYLDGSGSAREAIAASQVVLKATGIHEEKEAQQDNTINIIMPTGTEPTTYEVKPDAPNE